MCVQRVGVLVVVVAVAALLFLKALPFSSSWGKVALRRDVYRDGCLVLVDLVAVWTTAAAVLVITV